jgi:hypothetical protein
MLTLASKLFGSQINIIEDATPVASLVKAIVPDNWKRGLRERFLPLRVNHVFGPRQVSLANNEAAVTCVVKNGEFYLDSFVEHYFHMGFRHIYFLDNGSTDKTIELARRHGNVTVYESKLPIEAYQAIFKKGLAEMAVPAGWCLDADIDEYFDYPFSYEVSLSKFLEYLNRGSYTAVLTQMLDMFSERPLAALAHKMPQENLKEVYRYYDVSEVSMVDYRIAELTRSYAPNNQISNENTCLCFGGIRKTLFGINCLLSKHSLFRTGEDLELFPHVHFVNNARVADVSCALLHYKLVSNAYETALQNKKAFSSTSRGYSDLMQLIEIRPEQRIKTGTAVEFHTVADLLESNLLFLSNDYRQYAKVGGF